jgi:hypothetical protein
MRRALLLALWLGGCGAVRQPDPGAAGGQAAGRAGARLIGADGAPGDVAGPTGDARPPDAPPTADAPPPPDAPPPDAPAIVWQASGAIDVAVDP